MPGPVEPGKKKAPRPPRVWLNDVVKKARYRAVPYPVKQPKAINAPIPKWLQGVK